MFNMNDKMYNALVPMVVEQTGKGERSYDIYSRLLKNGSKGVSGYIGGNISCNVQFFC